MNARISIAGYEPKHLSWSTYDSYSTCGERQRLQKVFMLEQMPNWGSVGGTAVHSAVETVEDQAPDLGPLEEWHQLFDTAVLFGDAFDEAMANTQKRSPAYTPDQWYVSARGKKNETWWREQGPIMVDRWITWRQETRWEIARLVDGRPAVEVECNFTLPGDIPIKAFIDSVFVLPTGAVAVVDVKTGRLPETPGQLGLYKIALKTLFGVDVEWGFFWDAAKGSHGQPLDLSGYTPEYMAGLFEMAIAGHNAGVFLPKPQNGCGRWCGVARFCSAVGGELSHTVDLPTPILDIRNASTSH